MHNAHPRTDTPLTCNRLFAAIALALLAGGVNAQTTPTQTNDSRERARALDEVIVTGTRVTDRTVAESLSPIDVLSVERLDASGSSELIQALSRTVPSFTFPHTSITDGSDHVRPAQLRGLAPDQTLVLVNGKRRHTTAIVNVNGSLGRGSSPTDLNAIPSSAIARIEVLRDGAAAQYGTDAIAGVVNVVLKGADSGHGADLRYGEFDEGDGELLSVSGYTGAAFGNGGFVSLSAEYRDRDPTNRSRPDPRQQFPTIDGQPDPREASFDRLNHRFGDAAVEDKLFFVNAALPITDAVEAYAFANYSNRQGEAAGFFRRALDARNVPEIHPEGFLPLIVSDSDDISAFGGLRGALGDWDWDFSVGYGGNEFDFNVENSVNTSLGASSPTEFFAGTLENSQNTVNLDFRRGLDIGLAYPASLAVGAEYRNEGYEIRPGQFESFTGSGSQVFPGFAPGDAQDRSRHNWSTYADLEADLTDRLSASAAVRYEDYTDFGTTVSWKLSGRFAFTDTVAARATVSTGFRAPSLSQQFYSTTATNFIGGVPFEVRTFPVDNPVAIALGAEPLDAEESFNISAGLVMQPMDNWSLTIDAYRIEIDDRIVLSGNLTGDSVRAFLATRGFDNANGGRYFTNAVDTTTTGIDVVSSTDFAVAGGELGLTVAFNYNETDLDRIGPNPAALEAVDLNLERIDRVEIGRITEGTPKTRAIVSLDYRYDRLSADLRGTRYGTYSVFNNNASQDQKFGSEVVLDASLSWRFTPHFTLTVGADNLTDELPDEVLPVNSFNGILPFSGGNSPFGFNGRFWYGRASLRF